MLRQKFIDRLRNKYQGGGVRKNVETRTTKNLFGADVTKLNVPKETPIEPSGIQKALSFGAKVLKYAPTVARWGASKALGPLSLLLGANKAYGGTVIDPKTGVNRYSGEQLYTPFQRQTGGMYNPQDSVVPWQGTQMMKHGGRPEYEQFHDLPQEEYDQAVMEYQQGGMYNRMQQYQGGGMVLPGGEMEQIPGTDAVEFAGADHDEGGIMLDPQTEVEDGETMDQVTMARGGGQRKDYFFSSFLKKGGKSFADMHKDILRNGGDQQEIDWLASMQESAAGRKSNKVGTAKLGGVMKYQTGGDQDYLYDDEDITYTDVSPDPSQTKEQHYADLSNPPYNINPALVTSDETRDYNKYLKSLTPQDRGAMSFEDWAASREEDKPSFKDKLKNLFKRKGKTDEELYDKAMKRNVPTGAYVAGAAQLLPAAYSFLHKQPEAQQVDYTPGFTSPIIAERGKASKLERVNYNVERARNAADMRAINKYIETSGGGPANIINKMMAYGKKQQGDAKIAAEETRANAAIANREAQLAQQMEVSNLQRSQQAATTTAQLASQEAARADQVEQLNAAARQKRVDDMEYMKFQGLSSAAQGISGILGDVLSYRGQERLAEIMGTEGIYDRQKVTEVFMKEINPETGKKYTRKEALDKARDLYNQYNPKDEEEDAV